MNNWKRDAIVTLFSTLIGVLLALLLNNWNENRKINNEKKIVTENIINELKSNKNVLINAEKTHNEFYEIYNFFDSNYDEKTKKLVSTPYELRNFMLKYPGILTYNDSIKLNNGKYGYSGGELNLNFELPQISLTTTAWNTLTKNEIINSYNFNCIMQLEQLYNATDEIIKDNKEIKKSMPSAFSDSVNTQEFLNKIRLTAELENSLITIYNSALKNMKTCK